MKRASSALALALVAIVAPARASAPPPAQPPGATTADVVRAVMTQATGPGIATLSPGDGPRALAAGDLDGDGADDALVASVTVAENGAADAEVRALAGAGGAILWTAGPFPLRRVMARPDLPGALLDGSLWVAAGTRLDGDEVPDVLLATIDPAAATSGVLAVSGADGSTLWRVDAASPPAVVGSEVRVGVLASASARIAFVVPLAAPWDVDRDGSDDLLLGRYVGAGSDAASIAWTLRASLLSGADGSELYAWDATGAGVAPSATITDLQGTGFRYDVLVADAVRTSSEIRALVRVYDMDAVAPFTGVIPTRVDTAAPATARDVALGLTGLPGEGYPAGGFAVAFHAAGPFDDPRRGAITGPASLVGLGRGGIERFRITLPSGTTVQWPGDLNGDLFPDLRTVRVEGDSLLVESWSGHGTNVPVLVPHQMSFLEGDDYQKSVEVHPLGDVGGDGLRETLIGGGYPCGPRYQMIDGASGSAVWGREELRSIVCFGRLFPAGVSLGGAAEDVIDWTTRWACCLFGAMPVGVEVRARHGATGERLWSIEPADLPYARKMTGIPIGDVTGDGARDLVVVFDAGWMAGVRTVVLALDAWTGGEQWRAVWPDG